MSTKQVTRVAVRDWGSTRVEFVRDRKSRRQYNNLTASTRARLADITHKDAYRVQCIFYSDETTVFIYPR